MSEMQKFEAMLTRTGIPFCRNKSSIELSQVMTVPFTTRQKNRRRLTIKSSFCFEKGQLKGVRGSYEYDNGEMVSVEFCE